MQFITADREDRRIAPPAGEHRAVYDTLLQQEKELRVASNSRATSAAGTTVMA